MSNHKNIITLLVCNFWQNPLLLAFLVSSSMMAGAYAFQYIGGLDPCDLCWTQRYAHMAIIVLSGAGLLLKSAGGFIYNIIAWGTALALDVSIAVSGYHAGIEQKWWQGPTTCTSSGLTQSTDMESFFDNMMEAKMVLCDEIPWEMFGISMAGYNFLISLVVSGFVALALFDKVRKNNVARN